MDAYSSERDDLSYSQFDAPVLIAASSEPALERARRSVDASGARIGASVMVPEAKERILRQAAASAVWIELDGDGGAPMDALLTQVARDARDERYGAVVSITPPLVDAVFAVLGGSPAQVLVEADPPSARPRSRWRSATCPSACATSRPTAARSSSGN
jgi:hypothetical protein